MNKRLLLYYLETGHMLAALPKVRLPNVKAGIRASWIAPRRFAEGYGEMHDLEEEEAQASCLIHDLEVGTEDRNLQVDKLTIVAAMTRRIPPLPLP